MPDDSFSYELTPEDDIPLDIVGDEPFQPNTILIPLYCGTCHLLQYTRDINVGKWLVCPDCGRKNQIRAVDPHEKVVVELSGEGALKMRKFDNRPLPAIHTNVDWRTVPGAVDEGTERLPNRIVADEVDDQLEGLFDRMLTPLKKSPSATKTTSNNLPIPNTDTKNSGQYRTVPVPTLTAAQPTPPGIRTVPIPGTVPLPELKPNSSTFNSDRKNLVPDGNPWKVRHFFYPFFDPVNKVRFMFDRIYGLVALFMTFNYMRVFGQVLFSADPRSPDYIYGTWDIMVFYGQYLLAFLPLAVWLILLTLNGMTLFVETGEGCNRIRNWIVFRTEFALSYLWWILCILCISPFPGVISSTLLYWCGIHAWPRFLLVPLSMWLLFPVLLLSLALSEKPFELFHPPVWKSLMKRFDKWLIYYIAVIPLTALFLLTIALGTFLVIVFIPRNFYLAQIPFVLAALLLGQTASWCVYLYFRLLGAVAWSIKS